MKTIGLIGGTSWKSSIEYYRIINETVQARLGGLHSAKSVMVSINFAELEVLQREDKWAEAITLITTAARHAEQGGADFLLLCANTTHKFADAVQKATEIPLLHIADATAAIIQEFGFQSIGLLGTRTTMEEDFYKTHLHQQYGLEVLIPRAEERHRLQQVIYDELCQGEMNVSSKIEVKQMITHLAARGAEGVVLGCTELPLLVQQEDCSLPLFNTTRIHAEAAVELALSDDF